MLTNRIVPDVSFSSSSHDAYVVCAAYRGGACSGSASGFVPVAGTSAAAPSMAGVMALITQKEGSWQGVANVALYQLGATPATSVYHDVTPASSGVAACDLATPSLCNNSTTATPGFAVTSGFDAATGWGSIDIANLVARWPSAPALAIAPGAVTVPRGGAASVSLQPSGFGSAAVTYSCAGIPDGTSCSFAAGGPPTLTVSASDAGAAAGWGSAMIGLGALALILLVTPLTRAPIRRRTLVMALGGMAAVAGCGTDGASPIVVDVTVTATSATASATAVLIVTFDP